MKIANQNKGFTLTELLVSVAITAILMVGIATFFSSTFRNMFSAPEEVSSTQGQFVVSTILNGKFMHATKLQEDGSDYLVIQNDTKAGDLPFTYIGKEGDKIVFKDFFVFNGRFEDLESASYAVTNPAGIARYNATNTFVAAPMEDKIKNCSNASTCIDLGLNGSYTDFNYPIDVTIDIPNSMLYVADSGNGRIISVNLGGGNMTDLVIDDLDFPAGIEFYSASSGDYLFVTEPYKNQVLKVDIDAGTYEVVAGDGDNENCDGTAKFCKLNFPTGLAIGDDGSGPGLFIADTGNGRVLKLSDPVINLSDVEFTANLGSPTQISKVDFVFPSGSDLSVGAHGTTEDELHEGKYSGAGNILTYNLTVTYDTQETIVTGCPDSCTTNFRGFFLDSDEDNIFQAGEDVEIEGSFYEVSSSSGINARVTPWNTTLPGDRKDATITEIFSPGDYSFYIDLSSATLPGGFQSVSIEPYDDTPSALIPSSVTLSLPDGELGTEEDVIIDSGSSYGYPTGLGFAGSLNVSATVDDYSSGFADYDYISDFNINNFTIDTTNSDEILEVTFEAKLKEDNEGNPVWETYKFNASVNP